jgi:hypothetical protein
MLWKKRNRPGNWPGRRLVPFRILLLALLAAAFALVPVASAKDGDVRVRGTCSGPSPAKLKLSPEDGKIEVEFEVDQNRLGVRWRVVLKHGTGAFFRGTARTIGPSGSFELRRLTGNRPGTDVVSARATSPGGEVCRAKARI